MSWWYRHICSFLVQMKGKGKIQRSIALKYMEIIRNIQNNRVQSRKAKMIESVLETLNEKDCFSSKGFWALKKRLNVKQPMKTSIINDNLIEITADSAIRNEYEKEFKKRLSIRQIDPHSEKYQELSNKLVDLLVQEYAKRQSEPDFTSIEVKEVANSFNKKGKASGTDNLPPEILPISGSWIIDNLRDMANEIKNTLQIPWQFNDLSITPLNKKGSFKLLLNKRGLFLSSVLSKLTEKLVKNRVQPALDRVSYLQGGAKRNRSCADITFLLRGLIDHAKYVNKIIYLNTYDYRQCFDSMWL